MARDHTLHIDAIEREGYVYWRLECDHPTPGVDALDWACRRHWDDPLYDPEGDNYVFDYGCWLKSWFDELGREMLGDIAPTSSLGVLFPLAVRPCDEWDSENGGYLVRDEATD